MVTFDNVWITYRFCRSRNQIEWEYDMGKILVRYLNLLQEWWYPEEKCYFHAYLNKPKMFDESNLTFLMLAMTCPPEKRRFYFHRYIKNKVFVFIVWLDLLNDLTIDFPSIYIYLLTNYSQRYNEMCRHWYESRFWVWFLPIRHNLEPTNPHTISKMY